MQAVHHKAVLGSCWRLARAGWVEIFADFGARPRWAAADGSRLSTERARGHGLGGAISHPPLPERGEGCRWDNGRSIPGFSVFNTSLGKTFSMRSSLLRALLVANLWLGSLWVISSAESAGMLGEQVHLQTFNLVNHNFRTLIIDASGRLQTMFPFGGNLSDAIVTEMIKAAAVTNAVAAQCSQPVTASATIGAIKTVPAAC